MPSLYDNVKAINSTYVPQFVGSEFQELKQTGDTLEDRYNKNKALTDSVRIALSQMELAAGDEDTVRQKAIQNVKDKINYIASSPQNFEKSTAAVQQIIQDVETDPDLLLSRSNRKVEDEREKMKQTLILNKQTPIDFTPRRKGTIGPNQERIDYRNTNNVQPMYDYGKEFKDLIGKIAIDGNSTLPSTIKLSPGDIQLIKTGQIEKVDNAKVARLVEFAMPLWEKTPAGVQHYDYYTKEHNLNNYTPLAGSKEQAKDAVMRDVIATVLPQVFENSQNNYQQVRGQSDMGSLLRAIKGEPETPTTTTTSFKTGIGNPFEGLEAKDGKYVKTTSKEVSNIYTPQGGNLVPAGEEKEVEVKIPDNQIQKFDTKVAEEAKKAEKTGDWSNWQRYNTIKDRYSFTKTNEQGEEEPMTQQEIIETTSNAYKDIAEVKANNIYQPSEDEKNVLKSHLLDNITSLNGITNVSKGGRGVRTLKQILENSKITDLSKANLDKHITLVGLAPYTLVDTNPDLAGAFIININRGEDYKGEDKNIQVVVQNPLNEVRDMFKVQQELSTAFRTGQATSYDRGRKYVATRMINPRGGNSGNGGFELLVQEFDDKGKEVSPHFKFEDMATISMAKLKNSRYLGSNLAATKSGSVEGKLANAYLAMLTSLMANNTNND